MNLFDSLDGEKDQNIIFSKSKEYTSSPSTQWTTKPYNGDDISLLKISTNSPYAIHCRNSAPEAPHLWAVLAEPLHSPFIANKIEAIDGSSTQRNGPLARYVKLRVAPGMFFPPTRVSDPDMHHGTYVTHVPWCMPGSLTSGFLWRRWRGKRSRHSRRKRNPEFYASGKRPMDGRACY